MSAPQTLADTLLMPPFLSEERSSCSIKTLYSRQGDGEVPSQGEATWNVGRMVDVSLHGFGLVLQGGFLPGVILSLEPLVPGWNRSEPLTARVRHVRPGPGDSMFLSCEFTQALDGDELRAFLTNSR